MTDPNEPIHASTEIAYYGSEDQWRKEIFHEGLTKREYFAAVALQGFCAAGSTGMPSPEMLATYALDAADALINKLNKPTTIK